VSEHRPTVYIPTINRGELLLATLASLHAQTIPADVVVVDNGSTDGTPVRVKSEFPDVHVIELGRNLGFGPAVNVGVREHPADLLVFTNNDVQCEPTFVEALVDGLASSTWSVAGVLLQPDSNNTIDSAGVVVDRALLDFDYLHGDAVEAADGAPPPLGPTGAGALYRLDAFQDAGGFDDRIFAYLEDVDLALRVRARGGSCRLASSARAVHHHSATLGSGSSRKNELVGWSRGYLLRRYGVFRRPSVALRALVCDSALCAGQLVVDRTVTGVTGRVRGWQAAKGLEPRSWPPDGSLQSGTGLLDLSTLEAIRRRGGGGLTRRERIRPC
jgi:GT2 family glycosyltransferase